MSALPHPRASHQPDTTPLHVAGPELTRDASRALRAAAVSRVESGSPGLVVDLDGVEYIDMEGVAALFHLLRIADARGGSLRVVNAGRRALVRLRIAGLPRFATVEAAPDSAA
ncbi:STAS domain-containing protein [Yinghuangia seranimata]|uniref:STAS domain-containing protein n=1 Tax=Yinghuangia seranimata TaxID=408067 RepID=UPI00248B38F6|nr:STAS domain-containing protein [Yinghuangia seranimata]MDI2132455.1 STAS domain-containing protein [Yinghuangia seranimata]